MPTSIYLARHATVFNPKRILYGRLPRYHLSEEGQLEAQRLGSFLSDKEIAAIYTSPLLRARQTTRVISAMLPSVPMHISKLLLEVGTTAQGNPLSNHQRLFDIYETTPGPMDETLAGIFARILKLINRILWKHVDQNVVCVTHADPIIITIAGLLGKTLEPATLRQLPYVKPASITEIVFARSNTVERIVYFDPSTDYQPVLIGPSYQDQHDLALASPVLSDIRSGAGKG